MTYTTFVERYRDKSYIGSGGFAKVYKVYDFANNHFVALKVADVKPEVKKFTLQNEVELINQLIPHKNIIRYIACYRFNTGITGEMDFAVLPYYEYGNLEQFARKRKLSAAEQRTIIQGILEGVEFLHENNCIHRDLKSANILIDRVEGTWVPKIADFGLGRYVTDGDVSVNNSSIGLSFAFAAPEQIKNQKIHKNVDIWALGIIIYQILVGDVPFKGAQGDETKGAHAQLEISKKIINLELPAALNTVAEPYQSIIRRCLVLNPKERAQSPTELIALLKGTKKINTPISDHRIKTTNTYTPPANQEAYNDKTEIIPPVAPVKQPPQNVFQYTPPTDFSMPAYENPKANVTQVFVNPSQDISHESPKEPEYKIKMNDTSEGFSKAWIYIPLFTLLVAAAVYGLYWFLNYEPPPPPDPVLEQEVEPTPEVSAFVLPDDFRQCFDENRRALGGTIRLIPTEELMGTFEDMDENCFNEICTALKSVRYGDFDRKTFYRRALANDDCFTPLLNTSLAYHNEQLKKLPLLPVFYNSGQNRLSIPQKNRLDNFLNKYKKDAKDYGLLIIGRASKVGKDKGNKKLSRERSENIIKFIDDHYKVSPRTDYVYFGSDPPQLTKRIADEFKINQDEYENIVFGRGSDKDYALRLNQSVLLVMYPKKENPFDLID